MLKIEDCKKGVEIICINTDTIHSTDFKLTLGGIYTIKELKEGYSYFVFFVVNPCITLEEVAPYKCNGCGGMHEYDYLIKNFKLRRKEELTEIFNVQDSKLPILEDA